MYNNKKLIIGLLLIVFLGALFSLLIIKNKEFKPSHNDLGWLNFYNGEYNKSIDEFNQSVQLYYNDVEGHFGLATSLNAMGRFIQAREEYNKSMELDSNNSRYYVNSGRNEFFIILEETRDSKLNLSKKIRLYNETIILLKKGIVLNPNNEDAYFYLGEVYYNLLNYSEAKKYFEKAYSLNPSDSGITSSLGLVYMNLDRDYDTAKKYFEKAYSLNPKSGTPLFGLGKIYYYQGKYNLSIQTIQKAIEIGLNNKIRGDAYTGIGLSYISLNKYSEAEAAAKKAISLNQRSPDRIFNYIILGDVYFHRDKDYEKSEEQFKKALELNPNFFVLHNQLGWVYYKKGEYDKAVYEFKRFIELTDDSDREYLSLNNPYVGLTFSYFYLGDYENAKKEFYKVSFIYPDFNHEMDPIEFISKIIER
jgi:protein O-GlcNAc transferase